MAGRRGELCRQNPMVKDLMSPRTAFPPLPAGDLRSCGVRLPEENTFYRMRREYSFTRHPWYGCHNLGVHRNFEISDGRFRIRSLQWAPMLSGFEIQGI